MYLKLTIVTTIKKNEYNNKATIIKSLWERSMNKYRLKNKYHQRNESFPILLKQFTALHPEDTAILFWTLCVPGFTWSFTCFLHPPLVAHSLIPLLKFSRVPNVKGTNLSSSISFQSIFLLCNQHGSKNYIFQNSSPSWSL